MKQVERVLEILQTDGSITSFEAFQEIGCTRLSARIYDIRNGKGVDQHPVGEVRCSRRNRFGDKINFSVYYLDGAYRCRHCGRVEVYDTECAHVCQHCNSQYVDHTNLFPSKVAAEAKAAIHGSAKA